MTADLFTRFGVVLYGQRWQAPLARDLGVHRDTVRSWVTGRRAFPATIEEDLRILCRSRIKRIEALLT